VDTGAVVSAERYAGALVPCGHYTWFAGCLVAQLGQYRGTLEIPGGATPDRQTALYYAGGVRLSAEIPVVPSRLYVRIAADLLGAVPEEFRLAGVTQWTSPGFVGGLGAGLVVRSW
jgi:hypothetical protein